jgi:catechol 2,3-dioxygenase-like lactoylglutathione lyase family enzyme
MVITASALSLNVADERASAGFARDHLGFVEEMTADGFVSLSRPDAGFNLIFLRTGLKTFKPPHLQGHAADGLLVVFVVDDIDSEYARMQSAGVPVVTPLEIEPWGERYFQISDPNGIVIQLVQWMTADRVDPSPPSASDAARANAR